MSTNRDLDRYVESLFDQRITRRQLVRGLAGGAAALSVPSFAAACGGDATTDGQPTASGGKPVETLTWAFGSPPRSLDFPHSFDLATPAILHNALEGLLRFDRSGKLEPALAESWSQPDPLTYVYQLRSGVKFWDGSELTPDDVVFSMRQHIDPKVASELASYYTEVKSIDATGPAEVTIKLKSPDALFQYVPAFLGGLVVKKAFWEQHAKDIGTPGVLTMGTGPYQVTEYVPEQRVTLVRNEEYWGDKPAVKKATIRFIAETPTRLLALRSGELDGAFEVPAGQADQWERVNGVNLLAAGAMTWPHMTFQLSQDPWGDVHVRRAFAHATDQEGLVSAVLRGRGDVAGAAIVPPAAWAPFLNADDIDALYSSLPTYEFDLDKARAELNQSRFADGFTAAYEYPDAFRDETGKPALNLAENLKQLGVRLDIKELPFNAWLTKRRAHKIPFGGGIWFLDYPDPANVLYIFLHSKFATENGLNEAHYKDASVDDLLDRQLASVNADERVELLQKVMERAAEDLPYASVFFPQPLAAVSDDLNYDQFHALYFYQPWLTYLSAA